MKNTVRQSNAMLRENRCDEALTLLNTLPADAEEAGVINYVKGNVYLQMGQDEQAHLCYAEALKKGFVHKNLYLNFGMVKARMRRIRDAEAMFRQAADLDVSDPLPLNQIVFLYLGIGEFNKAGRAMDELTERFPELIDGYHHKADLLLGTGETKAALKLLLERAFRACGIARLHNDFEPTRDAAWAIHRKVGFREMGMEDGILQLMLTKEDYLNNNP